MSNEHMILAHSVRQLTSTIETMKDRIEFLENLLHTNKAHESTCASLKPNFAAYYTGHPCDCWVASPRPF